MGWGAVNYGMGSCKLWERCIVQGQGGVYMGQEGRPYPIDGERHFLRHEKTNRKHQIQMLWTFLLPLSVRLGITNQSTLSNSGVAVQH